MKILMICLGNICRSPLAQGILQAKADLAKLDWHVESAGTAGYHIGEQPHVLSIKVAKEYGIDISHQHCSQFKGSDFEKFDKIYVMDSENYSEVRRQAGVFWNVNKVEFLLNEMYPGENREVPDPWYGTYEDFKIVYALLEEACTCIIEKYGK